MKRSLLVGLALIVLAGTPRIAGAGMLEFDFLPANTFSGTAPSGTLTAVFADNGDGTVNLKITSSLAKGENLDPGKALYLNFLGDGTTTNATKLSFSLKSNTGFSQAASVMTDADETKKGGFKADGVGGQYDILFTYSPSTKAFTNGEIQNYKIASTVSGGSISASDFNELSEFSSGSVSWLAAVHVQNTPSGGNGSAWVGGTQPEGGGGGGTLVPEPSSVVLMGLGGFCLAGIFSRLGRRKVVA
jgi:hypothetical protein